MTIHHYFPPFAFSRHAEPALTKSSTARIERSHRILHLLSRGLGSLQPACGPFWAKIAKAGDRGYKQGEETSMT
jgi:hypothetical protein